MKIFRYFIALFSFLIILMSLLLVSYSNAKKVAEIIMKPTKPFLYQSECNFSILTFSDGRRVSKITGLGWQVLYSTDEVWANDVELYVSLMGSLVGTNPVDLRKLISEHEKKKVLNSSVLPNENGY